MDDRDTKYLDVLVKDYQQLRTELKELVSDQAKVLSIAATACVGLFALTYNANVNSVTQGVLATILIPSVLLYLGVYWIDLVFQQKRQDAYIIMLEKEMQRLLDSRSPNQIYTFPSWESFICATIRYQKGNKSKLVKLKSMSRQMITLGFFIFSPLTVYWISAPFYWSSLPIWTVFSMQINVANVFFIIYVLFLGYTAIYIVKILQIQQFISTHIRAYSIYHG